MSSTPEQPRRDRDWEHWPGRTEPDDGLRGRLRALFSVTDDEAAVEAFFAEHGRELEARTRQLAATIADLERREERTQELRASIEEMLRRGSAELDERQADLHRLAQELARREEAVAAAERDVAERRQELGAVELRRAAVERHEAALDEREAAIGRIADELQGREQRLAEGERRLVAATPAPTAPAAEERGHLLFVRSRSRLVGSEGPPPSAGALVAYEGERFLVVTVGPSPLPGDRRRCAFVEAVPEPDPG